MESLATSLSWTAIITCLGIVLCAAREDVRSRTIPNKLIAIGWIVGIALSLVQKGMFGAIMAFAGIATGFLLLLVPYLMKGIAAGDVKLLMVIGGFTGPAGAIATFTGAAVLGAVLSAYSITRAHAWKQTLKKYVQYVCALLLSRRLQEYDHHIQVEAIPYAVPILLGYILAMVILVLYLPN